MGGRKDTPEGFDDKMAVHYYGRYSLIRELLPLLRSTADTEPPHTVRVMVVLAAGKGKLVYDGDYDLKQHYGMGECADACSLYNDLMVEDLSINNENISFFHAFPGFVDTDLGRNLPFIMKPVISVMSFFAVSKEDCGAQLLSGMCNPELKGWHLLDDKGKTVKPCADHTEETRKKVITHTIEIIQNVQ